MLATQQMFIIIYLNSLHSTFSSIIFINIIIIINYNKYCVLIVIFLNQHIFSDCYLKLNFWYSYQKSGESDVLNSLITSIVVVFFMIIICNSKRCFSRTLTPLKRFQSSFHVRQGTGDLVLFLYFFP